MTMQTITDLADFRAGDQIEGEFRANDSTWLSFKSEVYEDGETLRVLGQVIRGGSGGGRFYFRKLTATRPEPTPPQELGTVILNVATAQGEAFPSAMRADRSKTPWITAAGPQGATWLTDDDLVSWTTTTITRGETVGR